MLSDPIADMLARLKNANMRKRSNVELPYSKMKEGVLKVMKERNYIASYKTFKEKNSSFKSLSVDLSHDNNTALFTDVKRISKPSLRVYKNYKNIRPLKSGLGTYIISTSQGIMSDTNARKKKLGGEVICSIY